MPDDLRDEVTPKNILMIGPTGVGKTEIARRLAKLAQAPFLKVEATKFTEVGYVGRDVDQIVRDLVERAPSPWSATSAAQSRESPSRGGGRGPHPRRPDRPRLDRREARAFRKKLRAGELDDKEVELQLADTASPMSDAWKSPAMPGGSMGMVNLGDMLGKAFGGRTKHPQDHRLRRLRPADRRGERQAASTRKR